MRLRRWFYAIASVFAVALVMFPLNFLWVGQSPLHAAVSSLLFGLPALLSAWTPKERRTGRRNESRGTAVCAQSRRCAGAGIHAASAGRIDSAANGRSRHASRERKVAANPPVMPEQWEGANPPVMPVLKGSANPLRIRNPAAALRQRTASNPSGGNPCCRKPRWGSLLCAGGDADVRYCDRRRGRRCYEIGRIRPVDIGCRIGE